MYAGLTERSTNPPQGNFGTSTQTPSYNVGNRKGSSPVREAADPGKRSGSIPGNNVFRRPKKGQKNKDLRSAGPHGTHPNSDVKMQDSIPTTKTEVKEVPGRKARVLE